MPDIKALIKRTSSHLLTPFRPGNILVIHIGRCGSTVLGNMLNQHPKIYWASELYEPIFGSWREKNMGIETVENMPEDAIQILKDNYWNALHRYYGFEMKPYHFDLIQYDPSKFIHRIEQMGFSHFIMLDRKNRLRKVVSSVIAHKKGNYHSTKIKNTKNSTKIDVNKVEIDFQSKTLIQFLNDYDTQFEQIENLLLGNKVLKLTYEDHISKNPRLAYKKVCEFLDLSAPSVSLNLRKTNPHPLNDLIENFGEVRNTLKGTKHEWMLECD